MFTVAPHCQILEQLVLKDSSRKLVVICTINYFFNLYLMFYITFDVTVCKIFTWDLYQEFVRVAVEFGESDRWDSSRSCRHGPFSNEQLYISVTDAWGSTSVGPTRQWDGARCRKMEDKSTTAGTDRGSLVIWHEAKWGGPTGSIGSWQELMSRGYIYSPDHIYIYRQIFS